MCGQHGLLQLLLLSLAVAVCLPGRAGADTDECALIKCDASDQTPVCGSNGVTYASECLFEFARCQTKTTAADTLTLVAHHACRSGSDQSPEDPCARPCSREYRPICASDGRTYNNECLFEIGKCRKVGLSAVKIGPCDDNVPPLNTAYPVGHILPTTFMAIPATPAAAMATQKRLDLSIVALFVCSVALKLLLLPSYTSTDFEVHRNWLSLTNALPRRDWYHEATSVWTLDYPPFFAHFEHALSQIAARVLDPAMLAISAAPVFAPAILYFQRLSVILTDGVLFYAIYAYCSSWPSVHATEPAFSRYKRLVVMTITVLDAGLLYVDHIHFQYNGMLLGMLILSATKFRQGRDLQGAFWYAVLLMFKHIYLYVAPLYFVYLLGHYCYINKSRSSAALAQENKDYATYARKRSISSTDIHETIQNLHDGKASFSIARFLQLGVLVVAVFGLAFGSVLYDHPDRLAGLQQIASRLFPVQRGLCHAYWAPNVWALYAFLDKVLVLIGFPGAVSSAGQALMSGGLVQAASFAIVPSVSPLVCALATFTTMTPVLYSVWRYPDSSLFMNALVYCMMCSFMLGYHVHEKAILQVLLPLGLMAADSVNDMRLYRFASVISTISLFPLLFTPAEQGTKVLLAALNALVAYVALDPFLKHSLKKRHIKATAVGLSPLEKIYLVVLVGITCVAALFPFVPRIGAKFEFLPLMMISVSCAVGNLYVWGMALSQHYRKLSAVKSYLQPRRSSRS